MAPKDIEVGHDLTAHARELDGIADGLGKAVDAANQVSLPTDAYGILCQPFRALLDPVEQYGVNALTKAVGAMQQTAENVRSAAEAFASNDQDIASGFRAGQQ